MNKDDLVEELLEQEYYVIDFLPEQVPQNAKGKFFEIEQFFLKGKEMGNIADKFSRIILKLCCYYDFEVFYEEWFDDIDIDELDAIIRDVVLTCGKFIDILFGEKRMLLSVESETLNLTVYHPDEKAKRILCALAESEGVFWWKPDMK
ncbi:MAG: hypothetical protein MR380_08600 [Lachnospiraceae bacterium]|nr:hypothetical protein [Lachnospiraceae bacterium]